MNNYKTLFHFLKGRVRYLIVSLIMIFVIQLLNFVSPLIVKTLLDDYIMGIEYDWVEVSQEDDYTVNYINRIFKQERYIDEDDNIIKNVSISFFSGGFIGIIGELLYNIYNLTFNESNSSFLVFASFILIGSILTGFGIFDKILSYCKCGLIVPSTGFANTMTSSAMDYKYEGYIKGIGANIFKLTGSIILYGTIFGLMFGFVRSII